MIRYVLSCGAKVHCKKSWTTTPWQNRRHRPQWWQHWVVFRWEFWLMKSDIRTFPNFYELWINYFLNFSELFWTFKQIVRTSQLVCRVDFNVLQTSLPTCWNLANLNRLAAVLSAPCSPWRWKCSCGMRSVSELAENDAWSGVLPGVF